MENARREKRRQKQEAFAKLVETCVCLVGSWFPVSGYQALDTRVRGDAARAKGVSALKRAGLTAERLGREEGAQLLLIFLIIARRPPGAGPGDLAEPGDRL